MTLHGIKEELVVKRGLMTDRQCGRLVLGVGLGVVGVCLDLALAAYAILGFAFAALIVVGAVFAFSSVFGMVVEEPSTLKSVRLFSRLWILFYIVLVVEFFALLALNLL